MLSSPAILRSAVTLARVSVRRNLGASAVAMKPAAAATDPIQKLFADKVNEYAQKKKASGGKLVDATKEVEAALHEELDKVAKSYGGGDGIDMTKFPDFKFVDPKIDNVDLICDEVSCKR